MHTFKIVDVSSYCVTLQLFVKTIFPSSRADQGQGALTAAIKTQSDQQTYAFTRKS